ncbi:MAG: Hpt domain-containing protein [Acidobacteria bacterium]|nr:Hpt domain-containing protein [Acidobacteriota bacterium]
MINEMDKEMLLGFIEEVKSYLPTILDSIENFKKDPTKLDDLDQAKRLFHLIKGSTSMVGYSSLSHMAYFAEDILDKVANGQAILSQNLVNLLQQTIFQIEVYLDGITTNSLNEKRIFFEVFKGFRRFNNLTPELDEIEFEKLLPSHLETIKPQDLEVFDIEPSINSNSPVKFNVDMEQIVPELLEVFFEEAEEHIKSISSIVLLLEEKPDQRELLQELRRRVHTLKGAAGTAGFNSLSHLLHKAEDLLDITYEHNLVLSSDALNTLLSTSEFLENTFNQNDTNLSEKMEELYVAYVDLIENLYLDKSQVNELPLKALVSNIDSEQVKSFTISTVNAEELEKSEDISNSLQNNSNNIRVAIGKIDDLVKLASESVVNRSSFEQYFRNLIKDIDELKLNIGRLHRVVGKLEKEYETNTLGRGMFAFSGLMPTDNLVSASNSFYGFDELEFDRYTEFHIIMRELSETMGDMNSISNDLNNTASDFDSYLTSSGQLNSDIQDKLMQLRMVPFATIISKLIRTAKVTAQTQGKQVSVLFEGEKVEIDKMVLEELADPFLHLLRNAVDHGIEPPALRQVVGKSPKGQIKIKTYYDSAQVIIQIIDDGKGIDPNNIRNTAISKGFLSETEANNLTDKELFSFLFFPGFSTAQQISEISGRGVGLDVVKNKVSKMKGTINLDSQIGKGTTFTIRLPLTLAVIKVILVKSSEQTLAVPLSSVTRILRIEENQLENIGQRVFLRLEDESEIYPLHHLSDLLKLGQRNSETFERMPVLIVNLGSGTIALVVDKLIEAKEIVVKSMGSLLKKVYGVFGATLMGDGTVVMIVNPNELLKDATSKPAQLRKIESLLPISQPKNRALNILIVDDSLSMRRALSELVKIMGWNSTEAKDGVEALELIQSLAIKPDIIILDIEMPRMDGYELTSVLRADTSYQYIPIIMLTSRSEEKHRRKAFEVGATEYLVKPYEEETLINLIIKLSAKVSY